MLYIILIIFHISFLFVKCENVSVAISAEMPTTSIQLMAEQIGETMVKMDTKQFSRQARFISLLRTVFDNVRFLVKGLVHSYNWYQPEFELGGCVMKYTRTLYPELMQIPMRLSYQNISGYLRSLYFAIYSYVTEMINENRQDIETEQQRIGIKVAEMTVHNVVSSSPATRSSTEISSSSISSSRPINHVKSSPYNYNEENFNYMQKFHPRFTNNRYHEKDHMKPKVSITKTYENELEVAQSFNDFSPRTREMDIFKFDKNDFLTNLINEKKYDVNTSFSLETENPVDLEKFETKHSNNYNMPTADSSSSPSSSVIPSTTTSATNIFDVPKTGENRKFSRTLAELENNLNVEESHKRDEKPNKFSVMYIGPRQFSTDYQDMSPSLDDTPTLDLNKNSNGNDDEKGAGDSNIFDFENVILESFGFNAKAVKSSSLARCIRGYVINLFRRTFEYFILM